MWREEGRRNVINHVAFPKKFFNTPIVQVSITMMDAASDQHIRYVLQVENVTSEGFDILFNTWSDSRFARVAVSWIALGEFIDSDMWDV